jgi:hypothetical protein
MLNQHGTIKSAAKAIIFSTLTAGVADNAVETAKPDLSHPPAVASWSALVNDALLPDTFETKELSWPAEITEWTKSLEKEFRTLVAHEATQGLADDELYRLEYLEGQRNSLNNQQSADEVLLQMKHDRVVSKLADALREYVEFKRTDYTKKLS